MNKKKESLDPVLEEVLMRIAGEHGRAIANALAGKELTDEELSNKTGLRINLVRKILYNLYDNRVINYRRERDKDSGWYIYYWRMEPERAHEFFVDTKRLLLQKLEKRLEHERATMYFKCSGDCPKLPFEIAAEHDFKCPRCRKKLKPFDNTPIIKVLEYQVDSLRKGFARG